MTQRKRVGRGRRTRVWRRLPVLVPIHGPVGVSHEVVGRRAVVRVHAHPHARRDGDVVAVDKERTPHGIEDLGRHTHRVLGSGHLGEQHDELVPP